MEEIKKFSEMEIRKELKASIAKMGFEEATPIQAKAIPAILSGKDVIGIAQTGTGKTCAFGVPAIEMIDRKDDQVQVLILCPTRELVIQIGEELQALSASCRGTKIVTIYGGQPMDRQIVALKKKPQIVVGTPGRVMDHMRRRTLSFDSIRMFVLDEADEMLNMGFREDLDVILKQANQEKQTVLLSATMSKDILGITKKYQKKDVVKIEIAHKTMTAPKIKQYRIRVQDNKKVEVLSRILDAEDITLSVIFCNTKRKVEELKDHLQIRGYQAEALHGDMKQTQRDLVMKKFREGRIQILIATDVAARGIDVDDIEMIFNFDIPADEEYYVHRIGRTGRAGKEGRAITFVTPKQMYRIKQIEKYTSAVLQDYEIPTAQFINEKKTNLLLEKMTKEIEQTDLTEEITLLENYMQNVEVSPMDIAAVLLKLKLGKNKAKEMDLQEGSNDHAVRLFLTIGKLDNMRRGDLKDYLCKEASISKSSIIDVEVLDKFSFVTVPEDVAMQIMSKLQDTRVNNRRLVIEVSVGKGNSKSTKPRSKKRT